MFKKRDCRMKLEALSEAYDEIEKLFSAEKARCIGENGGKMKLDKVCVAYRRAMDAVNRVSEKISKS